MTIIIERIQRFPIKGLSAAQLDLVELKEGEGIPMDRMYGFARHGSGFDPTKPTPLPKDEFLVLLNKGALAKLQTSFAPDTGSLLISAPDGQVSFDLSTDEGQVEAEAWFSDYLQLADPAPPTFVHAAPHRFTDISVESPRMMNAVSILNLASVRDLESRLDTAIDPARFRANFEIDGLPQWRELEQIGTTLRTGDVELRLIKRTQRCAATEVNPTTAERDLKLPYLLRKELGHMDMGVYAEVLSGGEVRTGAKLEVL